MTTSASDIVESSSFKLSNSSNSEFAKNKRDAEILQLMVFDQSNPHPLIIAVILVCVLLTAWLIYNVFFKPNLTGIWYSDNSVYDIYHKMFSNKLDVYGEGGDRLNGKVCDSIVLVEDVEIGVWNGKNLIKLFDGGFLKRKV